MDAGRCVEFGTPYELLTAEDGPRIFYGMVKQTGKSTFDHLLKIAKEVNLFVSLVCHNSYSYFRHYYLPGSRKETPNG